MIKKISKVYHTLKHLKYKQLHYQVYYRFRSKLMKPVYSKQLKTFASEIQLKEDLNSSTTFLEPGQFTFLNLTRNFSGNIDWNHHEFGKLWTYNLNYFDFLNQPFMTRETGLSLINDYLFKDTLLKDGKEPYPISLRGMNWIKFLSKHKIQDTSIQQTLYNHYQILYHNIEYHLLGNHLLENGFSFLFAAYYFRDPLFLKAANQILTAELKEQTLNDGAHFELSPMYHQIILHRLLDAFNLQQNNPWTEDRLLPIVEKYARKMLGWLDAIVYQDGEIPMLNDSTYGIAPTSNELFRYAKNLGLNWEQTQLQDSGYRKWSTKVYELVMDAGNIGPDYIPGHAHADTFNFELRIHGKPFIVDTGISTYEKNAQRQLERSTIAHNTVVINDTNQSNVWGGFRVAQRARIISLNETKNQLEASHDGYKSQKAVHNRQFKKDTQGILITDKIKSGKTVEAKAYLHFHPEVKQIVLTENKILFSDNHVEIIFDHAENIKLFKYMFSEGYNKLVEAIAIEISFSRQLTTQIKL